ncbi:MAG: hypothetical protein H6574_23010 [Lewinellaceae bacterium]|nr:hypothetical protein [Lewinellaceae bacterium]
MNTNPFSPRMGGVPAGLAGHALRRRASAICSATRLAPPAPGLFGIFLPSMDRRTPTFLPAFWLGRLAAFFTNHLFTQNKTV